MTTQVKETNCRWLDQAKWLVVLLLIVAAVGGNYYYAAYALPVRAAALIVVAVVALGVASWTMTGRKALGFLQDARVEMRKVVWPTRQETQQTTLIVIAFVAVAAVILWGVDASCAWVIRHIIYS